MKIEHFRSRRDHPREMYVWQNLLGVCGGVFRGADGQIRHCDASRGHTVLHVHPASRPPDPEVVFTYAADGTVEGTEAGAKTDLVTLNLGACHLERNRRDVIERLRTALRTKGGDTPAAIRRYYRTATEAGDEGLPAYAPIAQRYLVKKARQHQVAL